MKRYFIMAFVLLAVFTLSACDTNKYLENGLFSNEKMTECEIADAINVLAINSPSVSVNGEDIYFNLSVDGFETYVENFYKYLLSKNFKYLGTRGNQVNTLAGTFTTYYFKEANSLEEFKDNDGAEYRFVYSTGVKEDDKVVFNIVTFYRYDMTTLKYENKSFEYNTVIKLRHKSEAPLSHLYILEEENLDDLIISAYLEKYPTPNEVKVEKIYKQINKNDKVIVPFLINSFADSVLWDEVIANIRFYYRDSRKIEVYYDNQIYSLQDAYDNELLTQSDLIDIAKIHNDNCKFGHSWNDGVLQQIPGGDEEIIYTCLVCNHVKSESVSNIITVNDVKYHYVETHYANIENDYEIIYSTMDLRKYYENNKENYNLERNDYHNGFLDVCDLYDDSFFANNALVLIPTAVGNSAESLIVETYQVIKNDLIINMKTVIPDGVEGGCVIVGCHMFVEVLKSHLDQAHEIIIYEDGIWTNEPKVTRYLSDWYPFLNHVASNDILEIQFVNYRGSIAPGALQNTIFSTDSNDIANILNYFKTLILHYDEEIIYDCEKPGYSPSYYAFVTDDEVYYIYLHSYFNKKNAYYYFEYNIPEMKTFTKAYNLLSHSSKLDVYVGESDPYVFANIAFDDYMFVEYDNDEYYVSDLFYINLFGDKIRIIDERHFEYHLKYYEIVGTRSFESIYDELSLTLPDVPNYIVTIYYSLQEEVISTIVIEIMSGQLLSKTLLYDIMYEDTFDASKVSDRFMPWEFYFDDDYAIPFEDTIITSDMNVYATINYILE